MLSNTLRLNFCFFKIIHMLHLRYHIKIIVHILENKQKNKCVYFHKIIPGVRFWAGERRISLELILSLASNSPEPPLKHPNEARAKSAPQAKIFHLSKVIYELLWSFFPKYANKTTLVQYNLIHNIVSQRA